MYPHHAESIERITAHFRQKPDVTGLLLGGSIAHGFAGPDSDVDIMIIQSDADYARRRDAGDLTYLNVELCTYEGGFVDGKFQSPALIQQVAERGSEPARFAYADARVLFSRDDGLGELVIAAARYPADGRTDRLRRFHGQLEAWHWYTHEALKRDNRYLLWTAVSKLILFGGRLILAHNETLYPYHKWFLEVLRGVPSQPPNLFGLIDDLHTNPTAETATTFYRTILDFQPWPELPAGWGAQFMLDSELNWQHHPPPVDDL